MKNRLFSGSIIVLVFILLAYPVHAFLEGVFDDIKEGVNEALENVGTVTQEAIDRIRGAISADSGDISVDTFLALSGPTKKVRGISIVKSGDKMILAKRENGAIDRAAISTIKYQHIDIDVCQKIEQNLAADERELVTCKKDADTGSNFVKIAASNTKLWHQLVSLIQLR
ncbi:MAG: hypothetical protein Q7R76_02120 [Candidatus Woesearchaeota archaeon]|nr:hypothetical protein [Candidatus Woesearchaeota archaeon]